jgi:hypothetical protein
MPLTCPNCGSAPDPRDLFCVSCGHPVRLHAAQPAESTLILANGRAQWPRGGATRDSSPAGPADETDQHSDPQQRIPDHHQVRRHVPEPRGAHDGGWDDRMAQAKVTPQPVPASAASDAPQPTRASARLTDASAPVTGSGTRVRVANPRDQAESVVAAADPQSHITADDRRMGYEALGVSATLDPLSNSRFFWQLARRFALYFAVSTVISTVLTVLGLLFTLSGGGNAMEATAVISLLIGVALLAMFLFMPIPVLLGQWSRMLTFQAPSAGSALARVRQALDRHATPHDSLQVRALTPPGEGRRHYLELRRGYFAGYVSCFAHGNDLYVGWTFWIHISPVWLFLMRVGRRFQDYTGRGDDMHQTLRYEPVRATIAALHACTLEGVDIATGGTPRSTEAK